MYSECKGNMHLVFVLHYRLHEVYRNLKLRGKLDKSGIHIGTACYKGKAVR